MRVMRENGALQTVNGPGGVQCYDTAGIKGPMQSIWSVNEVIVLWGLTALE